MASESLLMGFIGFIVLLLLVFFSLAFLALLFFAYFKKKDLDQDNPIKCHMFRLKNADIIMFNNDFWKYAQENPFGFKEDPNIDLTKHILWTLFKENSFVNFSDEHGGFQVCFENCDENLEQNFLQYVLEYFEKFENISKEDVVIF